MVQLTLQELISQAHLALVGFSASSWLTFMVSFAGQVTSLDPIVNATRFLFLPWYFAAVVGPLVYVCIGVNTLLRLGRRTACLRIGGLFSAAASFFSFVYIASLAAPLFFVAALVASAGSGIEEATAVLDYNVGDHVDLGFFDFIIDVIDAIIDVLVDVLRAIMYLLLVILLDAFLAGVKAQFTGSLLSIIFLGLSMLLWPLQNRTEKEKHKKLC